MNKTIIFGMCILLIGCQQPHPTQNILNESKLIDYSNPEIQKVVENIEKTTNNKYKQIELTSTYVNNNINYEVMTGVYCESETASSVLENKKGDCVSSTKLTTAILSGLEIPVQIIEGCLTNPDIYFEYSEGLSVAPNKFINFTVPKPAIMKVKKAGSLHSWIRAYDGKEWQTIETTVGVVFPTKYEKEIGYIFFEYPDYYDKMELCYSTIPRADRCKNA